MSINLLDPVPKSTLRARIAERLRAAILAGAIPPGAPLVETALSERFDVSHGPLREALRQLSEEGVGVVGGALRGRPRAVGGGAAAADRGGAGRHGALYRHARGGAVGRRHPRD